MTNADAAFFVERTAHRERCGVIRGKRLKDDIYKVTDLVEKSKRPPSKLGVIAVYSLYEGDETRLEGSRGPQCGTSKTSRKIKLVHNYRRLTDIANYIDGVCLAGLSRLWTGAPRSINNRG
jgi:hypothetical protein